MPTEIFTPREGIREAKIASQELFLEALETLPIPPEYGDLSFVADGIRLGYVLGPEIQPEEVDYLIECQKRGILPFSELKFEYKSRDGHFTPTDSLFAKGEGHHPERKRASHKSLLSGGRFNTLTFDIGPHGEGKAGLQNFKEEILGSLIEEGYQIHEGELWLTTWRSHGYTDGYREDTGFHFGTDRWNKGIHLKLGSGLSNEAKTNLIGWFDRLVSVHDPERRQQKLI